MEKSINHNFDYNYIYMLLCTYSEEADKYEDNIDNKFKYYGDINKDINDSEWGLTYNTCWNLLYFEHLYLFIVDNGILKDSEPNYCKFEEKSMKYVNIFKELKHDYFQAYHKCFNNLLNVNDKRIIYVKNKIVEYMKFLFSDHDVNKYIINETNNTIVFNHENLLEKRTDINGDCHIYNKNFRENRIKFDIIFDKNSIADITDYSKNIYELYGGFDCKFDIQSYSNDIFIYELLNIKYSIYNHSKSLIDKYMTTIITIIEVESKEFLIYIDEDNKYGKYIKYFTPYYWKCELNDSDNTSDDVSNIEFSDDDFIDD